MEHVCAWCRRPGATQRVTLDSDDSVEGYRYFCNAEHIENWNTNVRPPSTPPNIGRLKTASFFDVLKQANLEGWNLLNINQIGRPGKVPLWRVNLQRASPNGTTHNEYTDYAEALDARSAMLAALYNARARDQHNKRATTVPSKPRMSRESERYLSEALDRMRAAVEARGS